MSTTHRLTAMIEREGDGYVALCPEAVEVNRRLHRDVFITHVEVEVG